MTIDSRDVRPGDLFVGLPGRARRRRALRRAARSHAGAWGVARRARARSRRALRAASAWSSPPTTRSPRCRRWRARGGARSARRSSRSPARPARRRRRTCSPRCSRRTGASSPATQNLNTEIGLPLTILAAPAGTEALVLEMAMRGTRPDRRAGGDRRARRRRHRQRRAGAPRAARLARGDRRGEGRAARRPAPGRDGRAARRRAAARRPPARRPAHRDVRRRAATSPSSATLELPFTSAHMRSNALAALAAARAVGAAPRGRLEVTLSALRGQRIELPGAGPRHRRLLQRQPDVDARRPRRSRRVRDRAPRRRARRHARARARRGALPRRDRRARGRVRRRRAHRRRAARGAHGRRATAARCTPSPTPRPRPRWPASSCAPGDTVLVKGSRGVGLEVVAAGLRAAAGA